MAQVQVTGPYQIADEGKLRCLLGAWALGGVVTRTLFSSHRHIVLRSGRRKVVWNRWSAFFRLADQEQVED